MEIFVWHVATAILAVPSAIVLGIAVHRITRGESWLPLVLVGVVLAGGSGVSNYMASRNPSGETAAPPPVVTSAGTNTASVTTIATSAPPASVTPAPRTSSQAAPDTSQTRRVLPVTTVPSAPPPSTLATDSGRGSTDPVTATPLGSLRVKVVWGAVKEPMLQGYLVSGEPFSPDAKAAGHPTFSTNTTIIEDFGTWSSVFNVRAGQTWRICVEGNGPVDPTTNLFVSYPDTYRCSATFVLI